MTNRYFAQPYDGSKSGFYFSDGEGYETGVAACGAEEFEIQYIDGPNAELFKACGVNQSNLIEWLEIIETLPDYNRPALFFLCDNHGMSMGDALASVDDVGWTEATLIDAATELFDEIYLPEVSDSVRPYIDYEAFARDCEIGGDMVEFEFEGRTYTCTNANAI